MPPIQMIFQDVKGKPTPRLPREDSGKPRQADEKHFFTVTQASEWSGRSVEDLTNFYLYCFEDLLPRRDLERICNKIDFPKLMKWIPRGIRSQQKA